MSRRHVIHTALIAAVAAAIGAAPAEAVTRYAKPALVANRGVGTAPCTDAAKPCLLTVALGAAVAGDDVQLAGGNYSPPGFAFGGTTRAPYSDTLVVGEGVTLHGTDPANLPVIHVAPDGQAEPGVQVMKKGVIRDVAIRGTAKVNTPIAYSLLLNPQALGDRVRVRTTAAQGALQSACAVSAGATLRNAVCFAEGEGGAVTAVDATSKDGTVAIRNVTGISTVAGPSTYSNTGLAFSTSSGTVVANISNSIFRGTVSDVRVGAGVSGGSATANFDHSNWVTRNVSAANGASAVLIEAGGNQTGPTTAEPTFLDAPNGDFRQTIGSPTINAGVVDTNNGLLALGGADRRIGITTDIGADEFDPDAVLVPVPTPFDEPELPDLDPTPTSAATPTPAPAPAPTPAPTSLADKVAPRLTGLTSAKTITRKKGAIIRFTLSEAASVRLAFGQPRPGRSVGGKCKALTKATRSKKKCTIANVKGSFTIAGAAGANRLAFKGRLSAKRQLALGRYTLLATPTDAAGNTGAVATRSFTLTR